MKRYFNFLIVLLLLFSPAFAGERVHLYDPVGNVHYNNGGFIPIDAAVPKAGFQWVLGAPPVGSEVYVAPNIADELNAIYNAQPASKRATYAAFKAAVDLLLKQGDIEAVIALIQDIAVPPEDEALRQQMLLLLQ